MMQKGNLSRRGFMMRSLATLGAAGVPAWYAGEIFGDASRAAEEAKKPVAPMERLGMGLIGCGGQGRHIMNQARRDKGVEFLAVCDVDRPRRDATAKEIGKGVQAYEDYRKLLDRSDIQAVCIGTPEHWHTLVAIDAMRKKKDVYCEKPLTLTVAEGAALVKVAKETKRVFQVGTQQRSDARFRLACELVANNRLGKIKTIETWIGANPKGGPFKVSKAPDGLNWDLWLGPTPKVDYIKERCHYNFRWWYDYSGGKMTDWGAHHNDIAQWALGMDNSGPVQIESRGDKPSDRLDSYNCHPRFRVLFTYGNGARLICSSKENGVRFTGEKGDWIFVSRSEIEASDDALLSEPLPKDAKRLYTSNDHMGNFLDCVRQSKQTVCPAEVGHRSVSVCHLGVISLRLGGKKLKWDPVKEKFNDNDEANKMLSRPYRGEWKL
jgi:predicted dehydrogenase